MADYTLAAKGTFDGSGFKRGIEESSSSLESFKKKCSSLGGRVKSAMGGAASAIAKVGSIITAIAGGAFAKGGIDRALNIEDARNKLAQMGMDVNSVMSSANKSVDGTKFSLASAATAASMLGASGVEAGEQMTRSLQGAAGVAAMGGRQMEEVSRVFSKVAAQGKLQGDELMQLSEMGVNATGALAKHLGVTQAEVTSMVRKGEIDFQTFSDAMYETFGEAAYNANNTFRGVLSNTGSALSRLSAKFADPSLQGLKKIFQSAIPAINAISSNLDPVVAKFSVFADSLSGRVAGAIDAFTASLTESGSIASAAKVMFAELFDGTPIGAFITRVNGFIKVVDGVRGIIEGLPQPIQNLIGWLSTSGAQAAAFGAIFAAVFTKLGGPIGSAISFVVAFGSKFGGIIGNLIAEVSRFGLAFFNPMLLIRTALSGIGSAIAWLVSPIGIAVAAIVAIIAAFAYLMTTNEEFRNSVMELITQIGASLAPIIALIIASLTQIGAALAPLIDLIMSQLIPVLGQIGIIALQLIAAIAPIITMIMAIVIPIITEIITIAAELATQLLTLILPIISQIAGLIQEVMPVVLAIITASMMGVLAVFELVWPVVQAIVETAMTIIKDIISIVTAAINGDWEGVWNGIQSLFQDIWNGIGNILSAAINAIQSAIESALSVIQSVWDSAWNSISSFLDEAWNGMTSAVKAGIDSIVDFFGGILDRIGDALSGAGDFLYNAGCDIIDGFFGGIKSKADEVFGFVSGIADHIASIKGPKQYDLKVLIPNGMWLMESLNRGLRGGIPALDRTLAEITDYIGEWSPDADINFGWDAEYSVSKFGLNDGRDDSSLIEAINGLKNQKQSIYLDGDVLVGKTTVRMDRSIGAREMLSSRGVVR